MSISDDLPAYTDLPKAEGNVGSAWGLFGTDDSLGLMNLLSPAKVLEAVKLVRKGAVFPLDLPIDYINPPLFGRGATTHFTHGEGPSLGLDDKLDNYHLQSGSQWDSLGHVGFKADEYYNGATTEEVRSGGRNTIEHIASRGIVARGILLDVADIVAERGGPGESVAITVDDLESARQRAGVEIRAGDVLLVHSGYVEWHREQPLEVRTAQADGFNIQAAGLAHGEEMVEYLWNLHVSAVVSDTAGFEVWPVEDGPGADPFGFLHTVLIGQFGMMLGELWQLGDLARDCQADSVYEFLLVSAPLNVTNGIGSPANAVAIK